MHFPLTERAGNFATVALECLQQMDNPDDKFTIAVSGYTFNFLTHNGFSEWSTSTRQPSSTHTLRSGPDLGSAPRDSCCIPL